MTRFLSSLLAGAAVAVALGAAAQAQAVTSLPRFTTAPNGLRLETSVKSFAEMRFDRIVRQTFDLSCGAAALATIMTHYWGQDVSEADVISGILEGIDDEQAAKIQGAGFSLLELKQFAEANGFVSGGFKLTGVEQLATLKVPAISLVNNRGYAHFVVIKGIDDKNVFIADPAFGNRRRTLEAFAEEWNQVILILVDPSGQFGNEEFLSDPTIQLSNRDLQSMLALVEGAPFGYGANEY